MKRKIIGRICLTAAAAALVSALPGCSWLNTGEDSFSCSGKPGSVYCRSAREVYDVTSDGTVPSPMKPEDAYDKDCDDCVRAEDVNPKLKEADARYGANANTGAPAPGAAVPAAAPASGAVAAKAVAAAQSEEYASPRLPDKPLPIRTPAQVMRLWVAPYVDAAGDLNAPGYVYTEIEARRWVIPGAENNVTNRTFTPLVAAPAASAPGSSAAAKIQRGLTHLPGSSGVENTLEKFARETRRNIPNR